MPELSVVIANGCVHAVGILNSFTYGVDFPSEPSPQNLALWSSGKLSAGVPVTVIFVSWFCLLVLLFMATLSVDVIKIIAKNEATISPFVFAFTNAGFVFRIISILN